MKIEFGGRMMTVSLRSSSAAAAARMVEFNAESPPDGYRWMGAHIRRRGRSGRSVNVELRFVYCDRRVEMLNAETAGGLFSDHGEPDL